MSNANQLAMVKRDTVDIVADKVRQFQERGEIHFPANYSPENAMKSAWLILQNTQDKNYKPVLETCTRDSIANALLDMVVQGLNPSKKQGYFIAYGKSLAFQRSYFGTMTVTKDVTSAEDIDTQIIYEDDQFEFEIVRGRKRVTLHKSDFKNIDDEKIAGAYCTIYWPDDREYTEIMTIKEIRQSWKKSKQNPDKEGSTHNEFPGEMAKRTVINRTCKAYMNTSNDSSLIMKHFNRQDEFIAEAEVEAEIADNANGDIIDVTPDPVIKTSQDTDPNLQQEGPNQDVMDFSDDVPPMKKTSDGPDF
ncbi:recombinase RecT [Paenibacillus sp. IHBB 10380]|uniref:recombinase RecT n=1 Tax=Paenibacillus sp. IHBB 10380 TaxID=1566358 RepID=UPI0005CFA609|nr:RecT family recombinase [Paenibacillus sp. IHBB 10380]AJS59883.1 recombinase [Paenibacillus sp. IHBB 10380]